jgi:hypothetical protein
MEDQEPEPELELKIGPDGLALNFVFFIISILILGINLFVGK